MQIQIDARVLCDCRQGHLALIVVYLLCCPPSVPPPLPMLSTKLFGMSAQPQQITLTISQAAVKFDNCAHRLTIESNRVAYRYRDSFALLWSEIFHLNIFRI